MSITDTGTKKRDKESDRILYVKAEEFIRQCYGELNKSEEEAKCRLARIEAEIKRLGTYVV